ncbi:hemolysin [Paraburkholderia bonniea]|nr:hemolysin [Paraburkholderia bonniea]WJF90290.1 hemolysin [Paraburkholderia bonniea]WJF93605.1 hemolysin [Paraburkholderia bonniea]
MAIGATGGLFALGVVAPTVAAAWGLGTTYDFVGDGISHAMGLSKDGPNFGKSFAVGGVMAAMSPLLLPLNTLRTGIAGKFVVGGYNAAVGGTGAFGATAMTNSGNPGLSGGIGAGSAAIGTVMTTMMPGPMGNFINQVNQILSGPAQNAITKKGNSQESK